MSKTEPATNPHCERQWPRNFCKTPWVSGLLEASYGARVITDLLIADRNIKQARDHNDDPESLPAPFTENVWHGLAAALSVCLSEIAEVAEQLESCEITR